MLRAYSRRTTQSLRAVLPLRLALPHLGPLLAGNVDKEARKDALALRCAGDAFAAGTRAGPDAVALLLEQGRVIDARFLARVGGFPVGIVVRYDEILPLRRQRVQRLLDAAHRILESWRGRSVREALCAGFPQPALEALIAGILHLYAIETRALSRAVKLPALLRPAQDAIGRRLFAIMDAEGARLARDAARSAYRARR